MIARIWHGRTEARKAAEYMEFLRRRAIPDYRATPGNFAALILQRTEGDVAHFITFSLWDSWDSIRRFAGDDISRAHYYPEDREFLLEFEPEVEHFEVGGASGSIAPSS